MNGGAQTASSACPCETVSFPQVVCNPAGLPAIAYRIGDFVAFRHQLLRALPNEIAPTFPNETALTAWQPGAEGDLAVQMVEWWAYVADILTFYNERIANEAYLSTALLPESVNHLVQLLGYRPRPALGSRVTLAGLLSLGARTPVTAPQGLQVQSKPAPGQQPQVFELDAQATLQSPDAVSAVVVPAPGAAPLQGSDGGVWLSGKVAGVSAGDRLLLTNAKAIAGQTPFDYVWINVTGVAPKTDPLGAAVTQINFATISGALASNAQARDYVLLRSAQSAPLWSYPTGSTPVITSTSADLASVARELVAGSLALFDLPGGSGPPSTPVIVTGYAELVWYANGQAASPPLSSPPNLVPAVSIPHTEISFAALPGPVSNWQSSAAQITVRWSWTPVGQLVPVLTSLAYPGGGASLLPAPGAPGAPAFPRSAAPLLLEDANDNAVSAVATPEGSPVGSITLGQLSTLPANGLVSPILALFNLMPFSRGKTVPAETLGSGNPTVPGQDFALSKSPVTYFADSASISGAGFSSAVEVSVNGVQWKEEQSFYGQKANAQVYVLYEDDQGSTHVTFGDGVNGALLPTGANNVVATYRYGAGAQAPAVETLTVVQTPTPGLKGVRNPLAPTGGADPDSPTKLRQLAPASVLAFNRAVSLDDYAAIAATAAGVIEAVAEYVFDPIAQRPVVTLWIAGDANAAAQAATALAGVNMPNQGLRIKSAASIDATLSLTYQRDPRYDDPTVQVGLTTALVDPDAGLLGVNVLGIGEPVYQSQIAEVCLNVPGVTAIHGVCFGPTNHPACNAQRFDPGAGAYFSVPDDGQHLTLKEGTAS
jgi:hypothetical protein